MITARALARGKSDGSSRYDLLEQIATGGMAVIRRGYDRWAQRDVAHKRLRLDREGNRSRLSALFQREYDTLARLEHPNIVEVYDYGFDEQGPYYAMELLSGDDLAKIAPLSYREACRVLRDVASALALVHARRFVHRDVSPNNVRLTSEGVAKLIDFGALTPFGRPNELAGTAAFIAPECLTAEPIDQRADLYSLGALAYWTLTQRTPIVARTISELDGAWDTPILPPSAYVVGLPSALDELVLSLLSKDPAARPRSAAEVIERLSSIGELAPEQNERVVAASYLEHPPLIAREHVLSDLRRALDDTLVGRGEVVALEAAPGLGKSALLDQLAVDAQLRGANVLRAEGGSVAEKHGIARRLIQLGTRIFPELEVSEAFSLSQLNEAVAQPATRTAHPVEALEQRARAAARLRDMLLRLSERSPLVILLDDADRIDEESASLLASMADELRTRPILLLFCSVGGARGGTISAGHEQLAKRARQLSLQSLDEAQLVELVSIMFGGVPNCRRLGLWLHGQTGGNPGQGMDLLRLLLQRGLVRYTRGTFTLPHDVDAQAGRERRVASLLTRLTGLSDDARQLFELVCLHHGSIDQTLLDSATGFGARRVLLALEQLAQRELIFRRAAEVSLRGESLRTGVELSLDEARRQQLHRVLSRVVAKHSDRSLTSRLTEARHLFAAGPSSALEAAELMASLLSRYGHELSISTESVPLLEAALTVFRERGFSELHCAPLLGALSSTGFYGNTAAQEKYLRPALRALSQLCGFTLAERLRPRLGAPLALLIGLMYGLALGFFLPRKLGRTGIKQRIEDFFLVTSVGMAVATATGDPDTAEEIVGYLRPLAGFPNRFAPSYSRDFCIACAELSNGQSLRASQQIDRLLTILRTPRFLLREGLREQLVLGCLNAKAHAEIEQSSGAALTAADELECRSVFFAPHAEVVRVLYYSLRGQYQLAETHRARAETLALRGGVSWTAAASLALRRLEPTFVANDAVGLLHASAELERLARLAPSLAKYGQLSVAMLALLRGKSAEAQAILSVYMDGPCQTSARRTLSSTYAESLNRLERFEDAREICLEVLAPFSPAQHAHSSVLRGPYLALARAEAGLGRPEAAKELLDARLHGALGRDNPFELGLVYAALAQLALLQLDVSQFDRERAQMAEQFKLTGHPGLTRQSDALLLQAMSNGLKPHLPDDFSSGLRDADASLDGQTVVESRPLTARGEA